MRESGKDRGEKVCERDRGEERERGEVERERGEVESEKERVIEERDR